MGFDSSMMRWSPLSAAIFIRAEGEHFLDDYCSGCRTNTTLLCRGHIELAPIFPLLRRARVYSTRAAAAPGASRHTLRPSSMRRRCFFLRAFSTISRRACRRQISSWHGPADAAIRLIAAREDRCRFTIFFLAHGASFGRCCLLSRHQDGLDAMTKKRLLTATLLITFITPWRQATCRILATIDMPLTAAAAFSHNAAAIRLMAGQAIGRPASLPASAAYL